MYKLTSFLSKLRFSNNYDFLTLFNIIQNCLWIWFYVMFFCQSVKADRKKTNLLPMRFFKNKNVIIRDAISELLHTKYFIKENIVLNRKNTLIKCNYTFSKKIMVCLSTEMSSLLYIDIILFLSLKFIYCTKYITNCLQFSNLVSLNLEWWVQKKLNA